MIGILFQLAPRLREVALFFEDAFDGDDPAASLAANRNPDADRTLLAAVDAFEIDIVRAGADAWEERLMGSLTLDPFVDLTYPLYRGYGAFTQWQSAKALFSSRFDAHAVRGLMARFQEKFGPLEHPDCWEGLVA
ncbi:hypothetical protein ABFT80_26825 [Mesorhizobium sp. SB112]|uniref:hypothetical protein n=1 Tax=Mesorhizobium sp. SB112 TaxID=3151853 RepID=UPI003266EC76